MVLLGSKSSSEGRKCVFKVADVTSNVKYIRNGDYGQKGPPHKCLFGGGGGVEGLRTSRLSSRKNRSSYAVSS